MADSDMMASTNEAALLKGKRIFIFEDNLQNRLVYTMNLMVEHKAIVDFNRNGRDVLHHLADFEPVHLIVLDLMFLFGGADGYDIFKQIRAQRKYDRVPIVAVSAADASLASAKTRELGFNGFIAKPIDSDLFPHQLVRVMNGEQVWSFS